LEIIRFAFPLNDSFEYFAKFNRTDPAGYTFATGYAFFELQEILGNLNHAITIIDGGDEPGSMVENISGSGFQRINVQKIKENVAFCQGSSYHLFGLPGVDLFIEKTSLREAYQNPVRTFTVAANFHSAYRQAQACSGDFFFQSPFHLFTITVTGTGCLADR
jgi:hypothetical protein